MVKANSIEVSQKALRASSVIKTELTAAKKESDEAERTLDALTSEREAALTDGSSDERILAIEKKIDVQRLRMERAEKRREILHGELELALQSERLAVLIARSAELRADKPRYALLKDLGATFVNVASILSKIHQHNAEVREINAAVVGYAEMLPILDVRIVHVPFKNSLVDLLTGYFPIIGLDGTAQVSWPGRAGYPQAVQLALEKLDAEKSGAMAAARAQPKSDYAPGYGPSGNRFISTSPASRDDNS